MENQIQSSVPYLQSESPASSSAKWSKIIIYGVMGLIVIVGSVFAGMQIGKNQLNNQQLAITEPVAKPPQATIDLEISPTVKASKDWYVFTDTNFGISFSYPKDWTVTMEGDWLFIASRETTDQLKNKNNTWTRVGDIIVTKIPQEELPNNTNNLSLSKWINSNEASLYGINQAEPYELDNLDGYKATASSHSPVEIIFLDNNGIIYQIDSGNSANFTDELNQILSTFKFTN